MTAEGCASRPCPARPGRGVAGSTPVVPRPRRWPGLRPRRRRVGRCSQVQCRARTAIRHSGPICSGVRDHGWHPGRLHQPRDDRHPADRNANLRGPYGGACMVQRTIHHQPNRQIWRRRGHPTRRTAGHAWLLSFLHTLGVESAQLRGYSTALSTARCTGCAQRHAQGGPEISTACPEACQQRRLFWRSEHTYRVAVRGCDNDIASWSGGGPDAGGRGRGGNFGPRSVVVPLD
jgi:hypothetical protein